MQVAVAVHELDSPYIPSDLEQRGGCTIGKCDEAAKLYNDDKVEMRKDVPLPEAITAKPWCKGE